VVKEVAKLWWWLLLAGGRNISLKKKVVREKMVVWGVGATIRGLCGGLTAGKSHSQLSR
jgi:hypothetical protein